MIMGEEREMFASRTFQVVGVVFGMFGFTSVYWARHPVPGTPVPGSFCEPGSDVPGTGILRC